MSEKHIVIAQYWVCDGMPDGFTLHLNESDRRYFLDRVNWKCESLPIEERSFTSGDPFDYEVDSNTFGRIKLSRDGLCDDSPVVFSPC
jgi:hypothetical protein